MVRGEGDGCCHFSFSPRPHHTILCAAGSRSGEREEHFLTHTAQMVSISCITFSHLCDQQHLFWSEFLQNHKFSLSFSSFSSQWHATRHLHIPTSGFQTLGKLTTPSFQPTINKIGNVTTNILRVIHFTLMKRGPWNNYI